MRYMLLIYNTPEHYQGMSEAEQVAEYEEYMAFNAEAQQRGALREGVQLQPTTMATTVRVRDNKTVTTDGPFAETKEQLGGIYILDCNNLDEAIELAAMIPAANYASVEVRPIVGYTQ